MKCYFVSPSVSVYVVFVEVTTIHPNRNNQGFFKHETEILFYNFGDSDFLILQRQNCLSFNYKEKAFIFSEIQWETKSQKES